MGTDEVPRHRIIIPYERWMGRMAAGWAGPIARTKGIRRGERSTCSKKNGRSCRSVRHISESTRRGILSARLSSLSARAYTKTTKWVRRNTTNRDRRRKKETHNFATRIKEDLKTFGDKGSNIRDEYRSSFYCCIGFKSMIWTSRLCPR